MIKNTPSEKSEHIQDMRAAFEHRATWFYNLIDEAVKRGLDMEDFARKAIHSCGCFHGTHKFTATDDLVAFSKEFANSNVVDIFEMDVKATPERMDIEFHYCPLVAAWQKLTGDESKIAALCDIAMEGDRGIAEMFPAFEFSLGKTIAKGDDVCEVSFIKVK